MKYPGNEVGLDISRNARTNRCMPMLISATNFVNGELKHARF